jgi:phosphonatase-like hydrolase
MRIDLVVFDMAGTTVQDDDSVNRCLRAALAAVGLTVTPAAVNEVMGQPKPEALRLLIERSPLRAALRGQVEAIHADFVARMYRFYQEDPSVREIPGASATFACLKQAGIGVALNTGFSREIVDVLLNRLGWQSGDLVDATVASDEVPRGRPHPDMIQHLIARLGIPDAGLVAKVGDTPVDLLEGQNAGCGMIVGVTRGTHSREQLEPYPHTHLIESVAGFPVLLGLSGSAY